MAAIESPHLVVMHTYVTHKTTARAADLKAMSGVHRTGFTKPLNSHMEWLVALRDGVYVVALFTLDTCHW